MSAFRWYPPTRRTTRELMDDPDGDGLLLERTLSQFAMINRLVSRMSTLISRHILRDMVTCGSASPFSVLDVGAGACDIPLWLTRTAQSRGLSIRVTCLDQDPRVVAYARRVTQDDPRITVLEGSALDHDESYDYVMGNHFLHHLQDQEISEFLDRSYRMCRRGLLINDLLRSYWSIAGFRVLGFFLLHNSYARADGETSIHRGFRREELFEFVTNSVWGRSPGANTLVDTETPGRVYLWATHPEAAHREGAYPEGVRPGSSSSSGSGAP